MTGAPAAPEHRSAPGNAMKADYELGQDNIQLFGLDLHNPVFVVSSLTVIGFVAGVLVFQEDAAATFGMLGKLDAPVVQRAFWCTLEGVVAIALLLGGGLVALQAAVITTGFPFSLALVAMCYSTWRGLRSFVA